MTPQSDPYHPDPSQQPSSSPTPGSSPADAHTRGGGGGARGNGRTPYASPGHPVSTTALSQADGDA